MERTAVLTVGGDAVVSEKRHRNVDRRKTVKPANPVDPVEALIESNMRLVLKIANDFLGRGLPWDDLVSEGNRGLITAASRFDPARGTRFSTYSAWWIKQAIRQAIAEQRDAVRVPIGTQLNLRKIRRVTRHFVEEFGREPNDDELAFASCLPMATIKRLRNSRDLQMQSLNALVGTSDNESSEFIDFLSDDASGSPEQEMVAVEDIEQLLRLLDLLPDRERRVLRLRFGLDGEPVRTLDEVGKEIFCTNERVRQIQNQALKRLHDMMEARA